MSPEPSDGEVVARLRARDETAYRILVRRHHVALVAVARGQGLSRERAEDVVQEAWIAVVRNLEAFEGRSSLKTWIVGIVVNKARKARGAGRATATFSELTPVGDAGEDGPDLDADAFLADGHWRAPPWHWSEVDLERACEGRQVWAAVRAAIEALPALQRSVVLLREVEGFGVRETEALLGLGEARQRALLHAGRLRLRSTFAKLARGAAS